MKIGKKSLEINQVKNPTCSKVEGPIDPGIKVNELFTNQTVVIYNTLLRLQRSLDVEFDLAIFCDLESLYEE